MTDEEKQIDEEMRGKEMRVAYGDENRLCCSIEKWEDQDEEFRLEYIRKVIEKREKAGMKNSADSKSKLVIPLGQTRDEKSLYIDLFQEPHMLVGGATNSGKSTFMHLLISNAIDQYGPGQLRLILSDCKKVDLVAWNDLPYLMLPVLTGYQETFRAAGWCLSEIDRRFTKLADKGIANIRDYNKSSSQIIPYILFIIDEVSDFSVADKTGVFMDTLIKIIEMGQAVGVHLVIATSRPSEDVLPPKLRDKFPSRLAFATASARDSRVVLGREGAEQLVGRGDALYFGEESVTNPVRLQTTFIGDEEINDKTAVLKRKYKDYESVHVMPSDFTNNYNEPLIGDAKRLAVKEGIISPAILQRHLRMPYARALNLIDQLEVEGIIGPPDGAKPRKVIVD